MKKFYLFVTTGTVLEVTDKCADKKIQQELKTNPAILLKSVKSKEARELIAANSACLKIESLEYLNYLNI